MKSKAIVSAIMIVSLTAAGFTFAKDKGERNDRGQYEEVKHGNKHHRRDQIEQRSDRRGYNGRVSEKARHDERGAGPNHQFYRGDRLPIQYRSYEYVVNDWHGHRLSAPPRGYHWVQSGGDYILVAIATGVILQLLLSN